MPDPTEQLAADGWVVLPDLLAPREVAALREAVAPVLGVDRFGRNSFEGQRTERVYNVLGKCPEVAPLVEHPRILALGERFLDPAFLVSSVQVVNIHPGESAQDLHCDDDAGAPPRPRPPQGLSCMWALADFGEGNGGTRLVPRSHLWDGAGPKAEPISVAMGAGSVLVYLGGVYHGGGAHTGGAGDPTRLGISVIYCQPWLRQFENQMVAVPRSLAARYSERLQRMLGYSMLGPMGNVDGRDPIRLLEQPDR